MASHSYKTRLPSRPFILFFLSSPSECMGVFLLREAISWERNFASWKLYTDRSSLGSPGEGIFGTHSSFGDLFFHCEQSLMDCREEGQTNCHSVQHLCWQFIETHVDARCVCILDVSVFCDKKSLDGDAVLPIARHPPRTFLVWRCRAVTMSSR